MSDLPTSHVSVMAEEVIQWLDPQSGQIVVDGTLGGGGHTRLLADRVGPDGLVIGVDRDESALAMAEKHLAGQPVKLARANFCDLPEVLGQLDVTAADAVLLDLGLSSDQLADTERGFSFDADGPLDLRFSPLEGEPAWRLIHRLGEKPLADLIFRYGEERFSRRIAHQIVQTRRTSPIRTSSDLAQLIRRCMPRARKGRRERIHPATRTFQALRIAVNDELGSLETALRRIPEVLRPKGRVAVVSFHSLEDRLVKEAFRDDSRYVVVTRKPIRSSEEEIRRNPRSRSARLRVAERSPIYQ